MSPGLAVLLLSTFTLGSAYGWYKRERRGPDRPLVAILRDAQDRLSRLSLPSPSLSLPTYFLVVSSLLALLSGYQVSVVLVLVGWVCSLPFLTGWVETDL